MAYQRAVFRSIFGRVITIVVAAIMLLLVVSIVLSGDANLILRTVWWPIFGAIATWAMMWRPYVDVDPSRVTIVNPFSTWLVPWGAIQRIDTKWALTLTTAKGDIQAFAAPAPSRYGMMRVTKEDITLAKESSLVGGAIRPGDSVQSVSGAAAHVIRHHWEELRDDEQLTDDTPASRTWHPAIIAAVLVPLALGLAGALIP